jgi:hypothetical protein
VSELPVTGAGIKLRFELLPRARLICGHFNDVVAPLRVFVFRAQLKVSDERSGDQSQLPD